MFSRSKPTPLAQEWASLMGREAALRRKRAKEPAQALEQALSAKVPKQLEGTLTKAFEKAFALVFSKGSAIIEKTYSKQQREEEYLLDLYAAQLRQDRKSLQTFSKKARAKSVQNILLAGVEGIGLGLLGIGLPDIPLFSAVLLRSIYEIAMHYGFSYDTQEEQLFILLLIETSLLRGDAFLACDDRLNHWIDWGKRPELSIGAQMDRSSGALSSHLLYMKFIQGIPIIGAAGGLSDSLCLKRVTGYAQLKYKRRFLRQGEPPYLPGKLD